VTGANIPAGEFRAGANVTARLNITDLDYRLVAANPVTIYETASNTPVTFTGAGPYIFTMSAVAVTVEAKLEAIPYHAVTKGSMTNGTYTIVSGVDNAGKAREDSTVVFTAVANAGFWADGIPNVTTTNGGNAVEVSASGANWSFTMPHEAVTIVVEFAKIGGRKIYSNGEFHIPGLAVVQQNVEEGWYAITGMRPFIILDSEVTEAQKNGTNTKAIRVSAPAAAARGQEVAFSLRAPNPVVLNGTSGLSFRYYYVKSDGWLPMKYVAFGDVQTANSKSVIWSGPENNRNFNNNGSFDAINLPNGWHRMIVPVPKVSNDVEVRTVFTIKVIVGGSGDYLLIDDIEFLTGDNIELKKITIPDAGLPLDAGQPVSAVTAATRPTAPVGIQFTYETTAASGISSPISIDFYSVDSAGPQHFSNWGLEDDYVFTVVNAANATISGTGAATTVTPTTPGSSFSLNLKIGTITSNNMTFSIRADNIKVIDDFDYATNGSWFLDAPNLNRGFWRQNMNGPELETENTANCRFDGDAAQGGTYRGLIATPGTGGGIIGRMYTAEDYSAYNRITFYFKKGANITGAMYFGFTNGGTVSTDNTPTDGTKYEAEFTNQFAGTDWVKVSIPLTSFTGLTTNAVTGWFIRMANGAAIGDDNAYKIFIDTIELDRNP
jgi:hypothetical protein